MQNTEHYSVWVNRGPICFNFLFLSVSTQEKIRPSCDFGIELADHRKANKQTQLYNYSFNLPHTVFENNA